MRAINNEVSSPIYEEHVKHQQLPVQFKKTGGAGFIGSPVIRQYIQEIMYEVVNVDALAYAVNIDEVRRVF